MRAVAPDLLERLRRTLATGGVELTPTRVAEALRGEGLVLGHDAVLEVVDALHRDIVGAGPLDPLLRTDGVTDVLVNGPREVYVDRGDGLEQVDVTFPDDEAVRRLAQRLASATGRRLDDASPYVDVRLPDGTRCHAVLAPIARPGTAISLRIPARRTFTLDELMERGTVSPGGAQLLRVLVDSRAAFLVTGGTGSGKTTLLATLLGLVDPAERLVLVEDSSELRPDHPHLVGLEGRPANVEGTGIVTMRDLVRQALRMRPRSPDRGRGTRCRGRRVARRSQHRARGRLRHRPCQLLGRPSGPDRGAGRGGRTQPRRRAQSAGRGGRRRRPSRPAPIRRPLRP